MTARTPCAPWNGTVPRSRLLDALSLLLPAGERFVIATMTA
jgi:predicted metal-dependent hydrolase